MRRALRFAALAAALLCVCGCGHARWPAKTLSDGVTLSATSLPATVEQLRAMPHPFGANGFYDSRVEEERQIYTVRVQLLRFSLATDGDIHLAVAQPGNPSETMIAEIPDPAKMAAAPAKYRDAVAKTRTEFIRTFGEPKFAYWRPVGKPVVITGPVFFDLISGQAGGDAGGAPNGVEIHPVLRLVAAPVARGNSGLSQVDARAVDQIAERALRAYQIPGLSLAIVRNGRIVYAKGYGFSNVSERRLATAQTQYQIGSVTKQFTAAIILQLAARHRLALSDRVTKYFPFFRFASKVTIRDLLDQRSGIADYNSAWMLAAAAPDLFAGAVNRDGLLHVIANRAPAFPADSAFEYSNSNYLLLGVIAERVTGLPLARQMQMNLFGPAHMSRTLLGTPRFCRHDAACGYSKTPFGITPITPWKSDWTYSAGGITSTAVDLASWDIALMAGRILSPKQLASMIRPRRESGYGYGIFAYSYGPGYVVWHDGTVYGFKAMNSMVFPQRDAVVVLANADYAHAAQVAGQIENQLFQVRSTESNGLDPGLPVFAFTFAALFASLPLLAMLAFKRRYSVGGLCAAAAYLGGVYLWPVGLAAAVAGVILVSLPPSRAPAAP